MNTPDIAFTYEKHEVKAFTDGDCWELARQIHLASGYTLLTLGSIEDFTDWFHAAVRLPDGRIVDIEGIWRESAWIESWQERLHEDSLECHNWKLKDLLVELNTPFPTTTYFPESERSEVYAEEILAKVKATVVPGLVSV